MPYRDDSEARAALEANLANRPQPLLERLEVASPCKAAWNAMMRTPEARIRTCGACNQHVYDFVGMTRREAEQMILERDGVACVRYFQRKDGTILLADCTVGRRKRTAATLAAAGLVTALAGSAMGYVLTREPEPPLDVDRMDDYTAVMGSVAFERDDDQPSVSPRPSASSSAR